MRRFGWVALPLFILMLAGVPAALAEKRIALLIGNKDYKPGVGALVNPLNDLRVMGDALKAVGFEVLKARSNAKRADMLIAIHDFASRLKGAGVDAVGFLYYSGHGIASAGENYLIPVDIDEPSTVLLSVQGVKQSEVLAILRSEAPSAAHYLVLDACRNTLKGGVWREGFPACRAAERRAGGFRGRAWEDRIRHGHEQWALCCSAGGKTGKARPERSHHVPPRACRRN
jgi:uncharacterized caspase-like protein